MAMCCFFYPWKMSSCRRKWILFAMRHPAVRVFGDRGGRERVTERERKRVTERETDSQRKSERERERESETYN